jgi:hypothetical protein
MAVYELEIMRETWLRHFSNVDYNTMLGLLDDYMATSTGFPPQVGHINKILYEKTHEDVGSAEESFEKIFALVSRCGTDEYGYNKALDYFNDIERKVLTKSYWKELGLDESPRSVIKGQYCRHYNSKKETVSINDRKQLSSLDSIELLKGIKLLK